MNGIGFDLPLQEWFDVKIPNSIVAKNFIHTSLNTPEQPRIEPTSQLIWLGVLPSAKIITVTKKGKSRDMLQLSVHTNLSTTNIRFEPMVGKWLMQQLKDMLPEQTLRFSQFREAYEQQFKDFDFFWFSKPMSDLKDAGLLVL